MKYNNIHYYCYIFLWVKANFVKISSNHFFRLHVYFAVTEESRKRIDVEKKLINSSGMLFLYKKPQIVNMWMHNTFIP